MTPMPVVAIVNDEPNLCLSLRLAFEAENVRVRTFADTQSALDSLIEDPADLALIDFWNAPFDGVELLRRLRRVTSMPVAFLSPHADHLADQGVRAEEFIASPCPLSLVVRRVKEVIHQHRAVVQAGTLACGPLRLDLAARTCHWAGCRVYLNVPEFLMLAAFLRAPGQMLTTVGLMEAAYGRAVPLEPAVVGAHVAGLCRKLYGGGAPSGLVQPVAGVAWHLLLDAD